MAEMTHDAALSADQSDHIECMCGCGIVIVPGDAEAGCRYGGQPIRRSCYKRILEERPWERGGAHQKSSFGITTTLNLDVMT